MSEALTLSGRCCDPSLLGLPVRLPMQARHAERGNGHQIPLRDVAENRIERIRNTSHLSRERGTVHEPAGPGAWQWRSG